MKSALLFCLFAILICASRGKTVRCTLKFGERQKFKYCLRMAFGEGEEVRYSAKVRLEKPSEVSGLESIGLYVFKDQEWWNDVEG